ncbi:VOC family protein [Nonomuraea sp. NPDC049784]|uniref:VOC family protein n=1 Tax=Nonomuraea sp. NPDC049784 TaxID=3154361 RepID=UPI0033D23AAA
MRQRVVDDHQAVRTSGHLPAGPGLCDTEEDIDRMYAALCEGGQPLMPLSSYGFSTKFGWVNDRFGVSWQLNLP